MLGRGAVLAEFLNAANGAAQQRVLRLLASCRKLQEMLLPTKATVLLPVANAVGVWWYHPTSKSIRARMDEIDRLLRRYRFRWQVQRWLQVAKGQPPTVQTEARAATAASGRQRKYGAHIPIDEAKAVELLLSLAEWGALARLLPCPVCQRWFMAGRTDQQFCSGRCTTQHNNRDKDLAEAAAYMRKYRKEKKEREQRQERIWLRKGAHNA
jgi:hypothetical protein